MKEAVTILAAIFLLATAALAQEPTPPPAPPQEPLDITGEWDFTLETPAGTHTALLIFNRDGQRLRGVMKSAHAQQSLDGLTLKGNEISFALPVQFQGQRLVVSYKGQILEGGMSGDVRFGIMGSGKWTAVRHQETPPVTTDAPPPGAPAVAYNISGEWSLAIESAAGSSNSVCMLRQEGETLTGTHKGASGEDPLTGTVKDGNVTFRVRTRFKGQDTEMVYTGRVESATSMRGGVRLGDLGEGTWTGRKQ